MLLTLVDALRLAGELDSSACGDASRATGSAGQTHDLSHHQKERIRAALAGLLAEKGHSCEHSPSTLHWKYCCSRRWPASGIAECAFDVVLMGRFRRCAAGREGLPLRGLGAPARPVRVLRERAISFVRRLGARAVGALLPRTGLFIGSMSAYRSNCLQGHLQVLADLGKDVLDGATVRTACFVLTAERVEYTRVLRIGNIQSRAERLGAAVEAVSAGTPDVDVFDIEHSLIRVLPGGAFAYWFPPRLAKALTTCGTLGDVLDIRQENATGDNFRFLRCRWEVTSDNEEECPLYNKGGAPSAFLGEFELVVRWAEDGREMKARAADHYGSASRTIKNEETFRRPGLTYSQINDAALRFRVHPRAAIYDMKGPVAFPRDLDQFWPMLGLLNSSAVEDFMRMLTDGRQWHPTALKQVPLPAVDDLNRAGQIARSATAMQARVLCADERSAFFASPLLKDLPTTVAGIDACLAELDEITWRAFGATPKRQRLWRPSGGDFSNANPRTTPLHLDPRLGGTKRSFRGASDLRFVAGARFHQTKSRGRVCRRRWRESSTMFPQFLGGPPRTLGSSEPMCLLTMRVMQMTRHELSTGTSSASWGAALSGTG